MNADKTELVTIEPAGAVAVYSAEAKRYAGSSKSASTKRKYAAAWSDFVSWCGARDLAALPAESRTVVEYLVHLAESGKSVSTIAQRRAAVAFQHRAAGAVDPTTAEDVRAVMSGIARALGTAPAKKAPLSLDDLRNMVAALDHGTLRGLRDVAVLVVGWGGAFRRSELVALDVSDLRVNGDLKITVRRSKTDQTAAGMVKVLPTLDAADADVCPVRAMRAWLDAAGIASGPVFRQVDRWGHLRDARLTSQSVALVVKSACKRAGLDWRGVAAHSLRSGFITACADAGVPSGDVMAVSGHKSEAVMRSYVQDAGRGAKRAVRAAFGEAVRSGDDSR